MNEAKREDLKSWLLFTIGIFTLTCTWILTNPLTAAPDEPHHLTISQAAARLQFSGDFTVPAVPLTAHGCFAFNTEVTAACVPEEIWGSSNMEISLPTAGYPPFYYGVVGLPSLIFKSELRPYSMRLWSGLLMSGISAYGLLTIAKALTDKKYLILALAVLTPSSIFYFSSVNPSALTIAGSFLAWMSAIAVQLAGVTGKRLNALLGGLVLMSLARADAILWIPILGLLTLLLVHPKHLIIHIRTRWSGRVQAMSLVLMLGLHAFVWNAPKIEAIVSNSHTDSTTAALMNYMLGQIPRYFWHTVATFGWLDTVLPGDFQQLVWLTFVGLIFVGLMGDVRSHMVTLLSLALFIMIPTLLVVIGQLGGYQGRYSFPLLGGMLGMGLVATRSDNGHRQPLNFGTSGIIGLGIWLFVIHVVSLWTNWRRNSVGTSGAWVFWGKEEWIAPIGILATVVLLVVSFTATLLGIRHPVTTACSDKFASAGQ